MLAMFKTTKIKKDTQLKNCKRSINVNEEYQGALRTKSYADIFTKAQLLAHEFSAAPSCCHLTHVEFLLEPSQERITTILQSATVSNRFDLRDIIHNYFDISAEASNMCTKLLKRIIQIQANYKMFQQILSRVEDYSPSDEFCIDNSMLCRFIIDNNPFSSLNKHDFEVIHCKYTSTLQYLKTKKRKLARKIKLLSYFNKVSGVCLTGACGIVVVAAMALTFHTMAALVMGPLIFSLPLKPLKKKLKKLQILRNGSLLGIGKQLDVAMKGTYILKRDFDMMIRLVNRLHDDFERNQRMVELFSECKENKIFLQVLGELKKGDVWFRKQVDELEEHVSLCLLNINKVRTLVIKELSSSYVDDLSE